MTSQTSSMQVSELLPCPFCGGEVEKVFPSCSDMSEYIRHKGEVVAQCPLEFSAFYLDDDLATIWNTRAMKAAEPLAQGDEQWLIDELENGITNLKKTLRETKRDDVFWNRYWDGYLKGYENLLAMATDRAALVRSKPTDQ